MRVMSVLTALGVGLGVFLWLALAQAPEENAEAPERTAAAPTPAVEVVATRSTARPFQDSLRLSGVAEAARRVSIKAQTEGLVISTPKRKGARIDAGELLCEIESGGREAELRRAEARLAQAAADARASGTLAQRGFSAETTVAEDAADLAAAEAEVAEMRLDIARTRIVAPFAGRLESDSAENGSLLAVGDVCAELIDLDPIKLVGYAPETAVAGLSEGAEVRARLIDGQEVSATLRFIARSANAETRTFRIEAVADNADERIRDGATVALSIAQESVVAHRLPHSALTLSDAGALGVRLVERAADGSEQARFASVEVLRDGSDGVWVAGLPTEADVILVGQDFVTDGAPVMARFNDDEQANAAEQEFLRLAEVSGELPGDLSGETSGETSGDLPGDNSGDLPGDQQRAPIRAPEDEPE